MTLEPGMVVDRFRVLEALGSGAMGEVWLVEHNQLLSRHALKVLRSNHHAKRFLTEGRAQASLRHPNLVAVTDVVALPNGSGLVMELVEGPSLEAWLAGYRPSIGEAVELAKGILRGLQAVHEAGIVHRDLKPANVLVEARSLTPRLTDFGLAKYGEDAATRTGALLGTPAYMAPEQVKDSKRVDARSDLFSFGALFYELLSGRRAFPDPDPHAVLQAVLYKAVAPLPDGVPEHLEAVVHWCLEKDPDERAPTAADALELLLEGTAPPFSGEARIAAGPPSVRADSAATQFADPFVRTAQSEVGPKHTLPSERDRFVGREEDLTSLRTIFLEDHARLVTLLGFGGTGKTRLAVRFGWTTILEWPGGVWWCDLSEATSLDGVIAAAARGLEVPLGGMDPVEQLGHAIGGRGRCLVVLDNFEPVIEHARATVGSWLDRAKNAAFLVTSRKVLQLQGEIVVPLDPLTPEAALALFVERGLAARRGFELRPEEKPTVETLVALLDHLPLCIELAAARLRILSPTALLELMGQRFRVLTGGTGRPDRHATLLAVLDGSWERLEPWEQSALAQLSVFEGGFTLEAAEAVVDLEPGAPWIPDVVQALVDQSFVRPLTADRFHLLVSIKEYARARLDDATGASDAERRHGIFFARLGSEEALEALKRHGGIALRRTREPDLDNLVAACRRALCSGEAAVAAETAMGAWSILHFMGPYKVGIELLEASLAIVPDAPVRLRLLIIAATACKQASVLEHARRYLEEALALARARGDIRAEGVVLTDLGLLDHYQGHAEKAGANLHAALALHQRTGNRWYEGVCVLRLANWHRDHGRQEEMDACVAKAISRFQGIGDIHMENLARRAEASSLLRKGRLSSAQASFEETRIADHATGDRRVEAETWRAIGETNIYQGHFDNAKLCADACLTLSRELGEPWSQLNALVLRALSFRGLAKTHLAETDLCEALVIAKQTRNRMLESVVRAHLGDLFLDAGQRDRARREIEDAVALARGAGLASLEGMALGCMSSLHLQDGALVVARQHVLESEALLRGQHVPELALLLCTKAELERQCGDRADAEAALAEAKGYAELMEVLPASDLARRIATLETRMAERCPCVRVAGPDPDAAPATDQIPWPSSPSSHQRSTLSSVETSPTVVPSSVASPSVASSSVASSAMASFAFFLSK